MTVQFVFVLHAYLPSSVFLSDALFLSIVRTFFNTSHVRFIHTCMYRDGGKGREEGRGKREMGKKGKGKRERLGEREAERGEKKGGEREKERGSGGESE